MPKAKIIFLTILFLGVFGLAEKSWAMTYYLDYTEGDNANSGVSKTTPWKCHPYMATAGCGTLPAYAHQAGDRFIFKGGVVWPRSVFPMTIAASGTDANIDYYSADSAWYVGEFWVRPKFDLFGDVFATDKRAILFDSRSHITFENIEVSGMVYNAGSAHSASLSIYGATTHDITIKNCYIHGWSMIGIGIDSAANGGIFADSSGENIVIDNCEFDDLPYGNFGGAVKSASEIKNSKFHDLCNMFVGKAGSIHNNEFYNINRCADGITHENAMEVFGATSLYNNYFHDLVTNGPMVLFSVPGWSASPGISKIYNNLFVNVTSNTPITIDQSGSTPSTSEAYIFNNTAECISGYCMRIVDRSTTLKTMQLKNNHWISDYAGNVECYDGSCGNVSDAIVSNNMKMSSVIAASEGYTAKNLYKPVAATNSTVGMGTDLSSYFSTDKDGAPRPQGIGWDVGAYEYVGAVSDTTAPSAPNGLSVQ